MATRKWKPQPRKNPNTGKTVWVARWQDKTGKRRIGWAPDIPGTYKLKRDAQAAIDACLTRDARGPAHADTIGGYFQTWTATHPRSANTNATNESRIRAVLDVELEGTRLADWTFEAIRVRHVKQLIDHMLREQGRAYTGANAVLGTLASMTRDAIEDDVAVQNPFRDVRRVAKNDPRLVKGRRPLRVFEWAEMHEFARACAGVGSGSPEMVAWRAVYAEPMVRVLSDCGLRIGELLPLHVDDLDRDAGVLHIRRALSADQVLEGTKTTRGELDGGRVVPVPPALLGMLKRMLLAAPPHDSPWLFPTPRGGRWSHSFWYRAVWRPGCVAAGVKVTPHVFRHAWVSLMRAALVDVADLADAAGHSVDTASKTYTHGFGRSFEAMRRAVGE